MAKQPIRPRYQPFRAGWYIVKNKRRICLAKGDQDDRQVWAAAVRKYWEVMGVPLIDRMRGVDWMRLAECQYVVEPTGRFATEFPKAEHGRIDSRWWLLQNWEVNVRTEAQLRAALDRAGVTDEMMSLFVPMPERVERRYHPGPPPPGPIPPPFEAFPGEAVETTVRRWADSWPGFEAWAAAGGYDERDLDSRRRMCRWIAAAFVTDGIPADRIPLVLKRVDELLMDTGEVREMVENLPRLRELARLGSEGRTDSSGNTP